MPHEWYKGAKILSIRPNDHLLFFYKLTFIAVDYVKTMQSDVVAGRDWDRMPHNATV